MSTTRFAAVASRRLAGPAMLVLAGVCVAAPADDVERAALAHERAALEASYTARIAECERRFVVTSCVEAAKRDRRHGLDALRSRQIVLDEARRQERSAARRAELSADAAERARRDAARAAKPAAASASGAERVEHAPARTLEPRREVSEPRVRAKTSPPAKPADSAARAAKEEQSRADFDARRRQAAAHREEVQSRAAQRLRQRPPAAPLPVPAGSQPAR